VTNPISLKLHIRVPTWAATDMQIFINGKKIAIGKPGAYVTLYRKWSDGDKISFSLPIGFKLIAYKGMDTSMNNHDHYALEYGPLLMAVVGKVNKQGNNVHIDLQEKDIIKHLKPIRIQPLHFTIKGDSKYEYMPYFQVHSDVSFTCYPEIGIMKKN